MMMKMRVIEMKMRIWIRHLAEGEKPEQSQNGTQVMKGP